MKYLLAEIFLAIRDPRCVHRSHVLNIRCLRPKVYDGFCVHHNATCFHES